MIRRELAKDPKLVTESWDRFLPQFRKRHLKTSEKTAKKNEKIVQKVEARKAAGLDTTVEELTRKEAMKKKVYTPFPPAQLPRKVRSLVFVWLFLALLLLFRSICNWNQENISSKLQIKRRERSRGENERYVRTVGLSWHLLTFPQQADATEKRRVERAEAFVAPVEIAAPTVEEKRRHRKRTAGDMGGEDAEKTKKKKRREKKDVQEEDDS